MARIKPEAVQPPKRAKKVAPESAAAIAIPEAVSAETSALPPDGIVPAEGMVGAPILAKMHGLTTHASYTVAAVRGAEGILAVKSIWGGGEMKIKFYPNTRAWGITEEVKTQFGFHSLMERPHYIRFYVSKDNFNLFLKHLQEQAEASLTENANLDDRFKATTLRVLLQKWGSEGPVEAPVGASYNFDANAKDEFESFDHGDDE